MEVHNQRALDQLRALYSKVKFSLDNIGISNKFYIAGGSVFSILNNNNVFADIDIYFYDKIDFSTTDNKIVQSANLDLIVSTQTSTTYTIKIAGNSSAVPIGDIQLIKFINGEPEDVVSTFDFNVCKYWFCNDKIQGLTEFTNELELDFEMFKGSTYRRYDKYIGSKGALDTDDNLKDKILEFLCDDVFAVLPDCYNNEGGTTRLTILRNFIYENITKLNKLNDIIQDKYNPDDRLTIFDEKFRMPTTVLLELNNPCDELMLRIYLVNESKRHHNIPRSIQEELAVKYPEYFI